LLSLFLPHMDCDSSMVSWFAVIGGSPAFILYFKFEESRALQAHRFRFDAVLSFFVCFPYRSFGSSCICCPILELPSVRVPKVIKILYRLPWLRSLGSSYLFKHFFLFFQFEYSLLVLFDCF
jgi:hypothetical protein